MARLTKRTVKQVDPAPVAVFNDEVELEQHDFDPESEKYNSIPKIKLTAIKIDHNKHIGSEPTWLHRMNMQDRKIEMLHALNWYNYNCDKKQARKFFEDFLVAQPELKEYKVKFKDVADTKFGLTIGWLSRMIMQGFQLEKNEYKKIDQQIANLVALSTEVQAQAPVSNEEEPAKNVETIQDRLSKKFSDAMGEIEGAIDEYVVNSTEFSTFKFLQSQNIAVQYATKIPDIIQPKIDEMNELLEGKDAQLLEGYARFKKRDIKNIIKFYETIISDAMAYKTTKIATRAKPKRKPVPPEKVVRNLKYLKSFAELGLVSIPATDILGMTELWVYNTRTRKIGHFVVPMHGDMAVSQLSVKSSAIVGFDEVKSVAKTLRKPKEKLDEFKASSKPQLRKFMASIRSVETRLKGRISPETILLRVIK